MKVANPKLTLYAFHLRNNLAQGEEEPVEEANHLWEQCQQLGKTFNVPRLEPLLERLQDNQENPAQPHILIWLNCHPQTEPLEEGGDYYQPLINLLCCRHKIIYAYSQSRWCNHQARKLYRQLDGKAKGLQHLPSEPTQRLKQLKESLTELSQTAFDYANHLRDLELHRTTIETNNKNYQFWLNQLKVISLDKEDDLELLQQFISHKPEKFIEQINTDLSYLLPSQQLFQQMIETIRGIVETEQAESDRATESMAQKRQQRLERIITVVSTGLAVSGISSQVTSEPVKMLITKNQPSDSPESAIPLYLSYYNFLDVLFHIIVGVLIALPVGLIVWWMQKRSNRIR
jgi:hypothetical protein